MTVAEQNPGELSKTPALVRAMFAQIAPKYDLLNHTLSLNIDKRWRRFTVEKLRSALSRPGAIALDLCCGTADLAIEIANIAPTFGVDFCHEMLLLGGKKTIGRRLPIALLEGDALRDISNLDRQ